MRKRIICGAGVIFALVVAGILLMPAKQRAGPWRLADGSVLSLAGVTYGKNHTMRYGTSVADYLYPVLTPNLRRKFGSKVTSFNSINSNGIAIWIWNNGVKVDSVGKPCAQNYRLAVADENGMESEIQMISYASVRWHKTNLLHGWELPHFPRRTKEIRVRIYGPDDDLAPLAEMKIPNPGPTNFPLWTADSLPAMVQTNGLDVSLVAFETGLTNNSEKTHISTILTKMVTRAEFEIKEGEKLNEDWTILKGVATSASGEVSELEGAYDLYHGWRKGRITMFCAGTLWRDEPAWKLKLELIRKANFPSEELWKVKGIVIPTAEKVSKLSLKTNIYASEIELVELKRDVKPDAFFTFYVLHARSPLPATGKYLESVEARDDEGTKVEFFACGSTDSTGGRGATIRERNQQFLLYVPNKSKTLDVTLAYTKSLSAEIMARPTVADSPSPSK